jgi:hypothetical protein
MSVFTRNRVPVAPSGDELLPPKPAPPVSASAAARKRAQEVLEQRERGRMAAREAVETERTREVNEREQRLHEAAQARQRAWSDERERLRGELGNAEAAQARCTQGVDLSTVETAIASVQAMVLRDAAQRVVTHAEEALTAHERSQGNPYR